jgi:hypothetical protein
VPDLHKKALKMKFCEEIFDSESSKQQTAGRFSPAESAPDGRNTPPPLSLLGRIRNSTQTGSTP